MLYVHVFEDICLYIVRRRVLSSFFGSGLRYSRQQESFLIKDLHIRKNGKHAFQEQRCKVLFSAARVNA